LSIPNQETAIPAQTALELGTQKQFGASLGAGEGKGPGKANSMGQDIAERHQQHDGV
jgi:hypothetical protein